jgi:hypothetical protein
VPTMFKNRDPSKRFGFFEGFEHGGLHDTKYNHELNWE